MKERIILVLAGAFACACGADPSEASTTLVTRLEDPGASGNVNAPVGVVQPQGAVASSAPPVSLRVDVVVAGAGAGGIAAALQAARLGRTVALLEETDTLGGQMGAAGVSTMDTARLGADSGIYEEFAALASKSYATGGRPIGTCGWSQKTLCFEPRVVHQVLASMLAQQPTIMRLMRTRVRAVRRAGNTVTGVFAEQVNGPAREITAAVVIDATEWGDLLPLAGIPYRAGKAQGPVSDPSICVQDSTYVAVVRKYPAGVPPELVLPAPPPGYTPEVRNAFAKVLSSIANCPAPTASAPTPSCYDWMQAGPKLYPVNWRTYVGYRGLPDSTNPVKYNSTRPDLITLTSLNWGNDLPFFATDVDSTDEARKARVCEAKLQTLRLLYYVQSEVDPSWSVATNQEFDTAYDQAAECPAIGPEFRSMTRHFPPIPYVREARRLVGIETLTGADIYRTGTPAVARRSFANALAVGDYMADLHGCRNPASLEPGETTADIPPGSAYGPFQVPMGAFIPATVDGFLAAEKNLSVTRIANGAIRLQPIAMMTGQAVGAIAALSIANVTTPRALPTVVVQDVLTRAGLRVTHESLSDVRGTTMWAAAQMAAVNEIMPGYPDGTFQPANGINRAQAAIMLARLFVLPVGTPHGTFTDVPVTHPAAAEIEATTGILASCADQAFCPDLPFTRADAAMAFARGMAWSSASTSRVPIYYDTPADPGHSDFDAIQLASEHGLLGGCGQGRFCPDAPLSRGDMAGAVTRVLLLRAR